jgi:3-oxoacyl-[acyl-carrier-protein] synthase III
MTPPSGSNERNAATTGLTGLGGARARVTKLSMGVTISGSGIALPSRLLSNKDLEKVMDTSDEWILQRTGIRQRHVLDHEKGESTWTLSAEALKRACANAKLDAS